MPNENELCACGHPLHYSNEAAQRMVQELVDRVGPNVTVIVGGKTYSVQRHYIAIHGLRAQDLPALVRKGTVKEITE